MTDNSGELRRHAEHCRALAVSGLSDRLRTILLTMATEFDGQADAIDASKPVTAGP